MTEHSSRPCDKLRESLPVEARAHLDHILGGGFCASNADAEILYHHVPKHLRGQVLACFPCWNASPEMLRECFRHFWKDNHSVVLDGFGRDLERVRAMLRQAQFSAPSDLPDPAPIWRGTAGRTLEEACQGLSWSLGRDAACWFATGFEERHPGGSIVVRASVRADQILFYDHNDGLHEKEVIPEYIGDGSVDPGGEADWRECARRFIEKRRRAGC